MLSKELSKLWDAVDVGSCVVHGLQRVGERRKQRAQGSAEPPSFQEAFQEALAQQGIEVLDIEQLADELTGKAGVAGAMRGVATSARIASRVAQRIEQGEEDTMAVMQRSLDLLVQMGSGVRPTGNFRPEYAGRPAAASQAAPRPGANDETPPPARPSTNDAGKRSGSLAHKRAMFFALKARVLAFEAALAEREAAFVRALAAVVGRLATVEARLSLLERSAPPPPPEPVLEDMFERTAAPEQRGPAPEARPAAPCDERPEVSGVEHTPGADGAANPSPTPSTEQAATSVLDETSAPPTPDALGDVISPRGAAENADGKAATSVLDEPSVPPTLHAVDDENPTHGAAESADGELDELDRVLDRLPLEAIEALGRTLEKHEQAAEELFAEAEAALAINQGRLEEAEARAAARESEPVERSGEEEARQT